MNKEFIPYEQILELKELGFNGILWQQAFRWFRDRHGLCGVVTPNSYEILDKNDENYLWGCIEEVILPSYEESEISCLVKLIEIVKNK